MKVVYICSPYRGNETSNTTKARRYSRYAADQGVIGIAPHILLPQFLNEGTERDLAMKMDLEILERCDELWVFGKPTEGMKKEIAHAEGRNMTIKFYKEDV